jgi:hypothetical protein
LIPRWKWRLDAGLNLSRSTLESLSNELAVKCAQCQPRRGKYHQAVRYLWCWKAFAEKLDASEVTLWLNNSVLASATEDRYQLQPERPSAAEWRQVRSQGISWRSEGLDDNFGGANIPTAHHRVASNRRQAVFS